MLGAGFNIAQGNIAVGFVDLAIGSSFRVLTNNAYVELSQISDTPTTTLLDQC
jgi:hypothetical protein